MSLPAVESPWYQATVTNATSFHVSGTDWDWLKAHEDSTDHHVHVAIHNGAVCVVQSIKRKKEVTTIKLQSAHGVTATPDLYFAVTSAAPRSAEEAPATAAAAASQQPQSEGADAYPVLPQESTAFPAGDDDDGRASRNPSDDNCAAVVTEPAEMGEPYGNDYDDNQRMASNDRGCCESAGKFVLSFVIIFVLFSVTIVINSEVSQAIGQSRIGWLNVIWWVLAVSPIITVVMCFFVLRLLKCTLYYAYDDERRALEMCILMGIWIYCFVIAVCTPYAWAHAQYQAAVRLTAPSRTVSYHCWNNPTAPMSQGTTEFVFLEEPFWRIDTTQGMQKIGVVPETDDASSYSFCVAPLVYSGSVPCNYTTFYAVCYHSLAGASPCTAADMAACGWNTLPVNGIVQRVINRNEEFFKVTESDTEYDYIMLAFNRATAGNRGQSLPVVYAGTSPTEVADLVDDYELITNQLRGVIYGVHFILSAITAALYLMGFDHFLPCDC